LAEVGDLVEGAGALEIGEEGVETGTAGELVLDAVVEDRLVGHQEVSAVQPRPVAGAGEVGDACGVVTAGAPFRQQPVQGGLIDVECGAAGDQQIIACPADEPVGAGAADQDVAALAADEQVVAVAADEHTRTATALEPVVADSAVQPGRQADAAGDLDVVVPSLAVGDDATGRCKRALRNAVDRYVDAARVAYGTEDDGIAAQRPADGQRVTLNLGRLYREQLAGDRTDAAFFVSGGDLHGVGTGVCVDVVQLQAARAGDGLRGAVAPVDVERETG